MSAQGRLLPFVAAPTVNGVFSTAVVQVTTPWITRRRVSGEELTLAATRIAAALLTPLLGGSATC